MYLLLVDDEAAELKFWTLLGIIHKLLDDKIATFTIFHKEGVKQASHILTGKSYSCLVALTGWLCFCL